MSEQTNYYHTDWEATCNLRDETIAARDREIAEKTAFINEEARKIAEQAKRIAGLEAKLKPLAECELPEDNDEFNADEWSGGNYDDAHSLGVVAGKVRLARELLNALSSDPQPPADHFEEAKRIVASWPEWKREVFQKALRAQPAGETEQAKE